MKITGTVWKFPQEDINTDQITLMIYAHLPPEERAKHSLETLDPEFASKVKPGDIVVAGMNFGCGSSRPAHAVFKALGVGAIIAESFGRIFFRSSISDGVLVTPCPGIVDFVNAGDRLELDVVSGQAKNLATGKLLSFAPLPSFLRETVECGGEKAYIKARLTRNAKTAVA